MPEVDVRPLNAGGTPSLLLTPGPDQPTTLLYVHGGAYVMGSAFGYRPLAGALALAADYRLAPEHPFPAALEDVLRAYLWMLDRGTDPKRITLAGDSSGGGLALSLLISLRQQELPLPGGVVLLCPGVDLTCSVPRQPTEEPQPLGSMDLPDCVQAYLAGHPIDDPVVNPLGADLTGLPPMLVQVATDDTFRNEAHLLVDHARRHGVDARLELYSAATHVFHIFWSFLPEAADALAQAGRFARDTTERAGVIAVGSAAGWPPEDSQRRVGSDRRSRR